MILMECHYVDCVIEVFESCPTIVSRSFVHPKRRMICLMWSESLNTHGSRHLVCSFATDIDVHDVCHHTNGTMFFSNIEVVMCLLVSVCQQSHT